MILNAFCCHLSSSNYTEVNDYLTLDQVKSCIALGLYYRLLSCGYEYRKIEVKTIVEAIDKEVPTIVMNGMNETSGANLGILEDAGLKDA